MNNEDFLQTKGTVIKLLGNNTFLIKCNNGETIKATVAARFRTPTGGRRAKVIVADQVKVEISLRDLKKGQIVSFVQEKKKIN
jgi:translation initiation factor IF-1